jgi:hypothetical protein
VLLPLIARPCHDAAASCPGCGAIYTFPDDANGKKTRCKKCQRIFVVAVAKPANELDFSDMPPPEPPAVKRKTTSSGRTVLFLALLAFLAVGLMTGAGILVWVFWPQGVVPITGAFSSRVNDANFQQLKLGMRLDQVQAVLGEGEALADGEIPPDLKERIDDPKVTGQIDLVEPQRWRRWGGDQETIYVGLSETAAGDRVTVLAFGKASGLKLECGSIFAREPVAGKPVPSSQQAKRDAPGEGKTGDVKGKPTEAQLRQALTKENYAKLRKGLTEQEVVQILGPPVTNRVLERHAGFVSRQMIWQLGLTYVIAAFHNGKLQEMDSGNGLGGPLPSANSPAPAPQPPPEPAAGETHYKKAKLDKILLEYRGTTVLNFVLDVKGKKINVLPWENVKFFDADGKEIPRGRWGAALQEGKTVLDVTTIRMIISQLGGEVELIKEWRVVKK